MVLGELWNDAKDTVSNLYDMGKNDNDVNVTFEGRRDFLKIMGAGFAGHQTAKELRNPSSTTAWDAASPHQIGDAFGSLDIQGDVSIGDLDVSYGGDAPETATRTPRPESTDFSSQKTTPNDDGGSTDTPTPEPADPTPTQEMTEVPPGSDYVMGEVFDSNDVSAINSFFQDFSNEYGEIESIDMYFEGEDNGAGNWVLEVEKEGETDEFDLIDNGEYNEEHEYNIDEDEMDRLLTAKQEGSLRDVFDESEYISSS